MKKTMLGVSTKSINTEKYIKQLRLIVSWIKNNARGTIVAATGFGKSFIAIIAIKKMNKLREDSKTIIIVPTRPLKDQWEGHIKSFGLKNVEVFVVNTIALKQVKYVCDLLVVDEIHLMASEQFSRIFYLVKYKWILGLTATLERLDGKHVFIKKHSPVIGTVTQLDAIKNGWISDFVEINVAVPLTMQETISLSNLDKSIRYYLSKFGDFTLMRNCMNTENAKAFAASHYPTQDPSLMIPEIIKWAVQGHRYVKKRQEFLYNNSTKVSAAVEIINSLDLKTILFSQSIHFADEVASNLGSKAVTYHSELKSETRSVERVKTYKTQSGAEKFKQSKDKAFIKVTENGYEVHYKEYKVFGAKTLKEEALRLFKKNSSKVNVICTAKALDQGFDEADIELGIDGSRTSNPTQRTQRTGRIARNYTYKDGTKKRGVFVNLYVPNSRDEGWLRACQKGSEDRIIWLNSVSECVSTIKKTVK